MLKKKLVAVVAAFSLLVSFGGVGSAGLSASYSSKLSSGGSAGQVTIYSEVYRNQVYIYSGAYKYDFGVKSYIKDSSTLYTYFVVKGTYTDYSGDSITFSEEGSGNSITYTKSAHTKDWYSKLSATVKTSSTSFGSTSQQISINYS